MASKYSQRSLGVGCAGACGYVGAQPRLSVQPSQTGFNQNIGRQLQTPVVSPGLQNVYLWNSKVGNSTWTYLDYFTTVAWQFLKKNLTAACHSAANIQSGDCGPSYTFNEIRQLIQQKFTTPDDATNQYSIYHNQDESGMKGFWLPLKGPNGEPFIPRQDDDGFWIWFLQQLGYTKLADIGNVGAAPRTNMRPSQTGFKQTVSRQLQTPVISPGLQNVYLWSSKVGNSAWTYLDYFVTVAWQKCQQFGVVSNQVTPDLIKQLIQQKFTTPDDATNQYSIYHNQAESGGIKGFWIPVKGPNGEPFIPRQDDDGFWYWFLNTGLEIRTGLPGLTHKNAPSH